MVSDLDLIIPISSSMTISMPLNGQPFVTHAPFGKLAKLCGFAENIEVLNSLQRPKKVTMIGSDGKRYIFLCKPEDDMRKDSRLMELNAIINRLLKKNGDSRRRDMGNFTSLSRDSYVCRDTIK